MQHRGYVQRDGRALVPTFTAFATNNLLEKQFEQLAYRLGREKAIVAIAHKLLVIIWHVLTAKVADRRAEPQQVARYFIRWGRQLRVKTTLGLKASEVQSSPGSDSTEPDASAGT